MINIPTRWLSADTAIRSPEHDILGRNRFAEELAARIVNWHGKESLVLALNGPWGIGKTSLANLMLHYLNPNPQEPHMKVVHFSPWQWAAQDGVFEAFFREIGAKLERVNQPQQTDELVAEWTRYGAILERPASEPQSIYDMKRELREKLAHVRPLLVVIDDIDRLDPEEVKLVFQLVKANADFPNVCYFLLFQRNVVESMLAGNLPPTHGAEYLKKIIQIAFDVPQTNRSVLSKYLKREVEAILADAGLGATYSKHRWNGCFESGFSDLFTNVRDVKRFLGSAAFHVGVLKYGNTLELDAVDLIALESLRTFEPGVYGAIASEKKAILGAEEDVFQTREERKRQREELWGRVLTQSSLERGQAVRQLLAYLFPVLPDNNEEVEEWSRSYRVCTPHGFDRYFLLGVPEGEISRTTVNELVENSHDSSFIERRLRDAHARNQLVELLRRLDAFIGEVPPKSCAAMLLGIFKSGHLREVQQHWFANFSSFESFASIATSLLEKLPLDQRKQNFLRAIRYGSDPALAVKVLGIQAGLLAEKSADRKSAISSEDMSELENACVEKIRDLSTESAFLKHPYFLLLLDLWVSKGPSLEVEQWTLQQLATKQGTVDLIKPFLSSVKSMGDFALDPDELMVAMLKLEKLASLNQILEKVTNYKLSDSDEGDVRVAASLFVQGVEARRRWETTRRENEALNSGVVNPVPE